MKIFIALALASASFAQVAEKAGPVDTSNTSPVCIKTESEGSDHKTAMICSRADLTRDEREALQTEALVASRAENDYHRRRMQIQEQSARDLADLKKLEDAAVAAINKHNASQQASLKQHGAEGCGFTPEFRLTCKP